MKLFSVEQGLFLILGYGVFIMIITYLFAGTYNKTKEQFLVAERKIKELPAAFSIAATWIWAPALFIGAEQAYTQGIPGLFWFTVPNVLCLIVFGYFSVKVREKIPDGYSMSGYIQDKFSRRAHNVYMFQFTGLAVLSFAVQLLAGGRIVSSLTGLPFIWITLLFSGIAFLYSFLSGIKGSVITDYVQMILIYGACIFIIPWTLYNAGGISVVLEGLGGQTGTYTSLFTGDGLDVFLNFGIPTTIGLMAGPFGDQSFWQRTFSIQYDKIKGAYIKGALIFAFVPLVMSLLGFLGAGIGYETVDTDLINLHMVAKFLPTWVIIPFVYVLLSGLISTLDSNYCAISSIAGHDISKRMNNQGHKNIVLLSRFGMIVLAFLGILIANIPGIEIVYLFLVYGILRSSTLLPTVLAILTNKLHEAGIFWGVLIAIIIGLPIFAYGNLNGITSMTIAGSLITVLSSGIIAVVLSRMKYNG